jgi:hypothetical protein
VRVDAGVRALFDRRAFGFFEALDATTHDGKGLGIREVKGEAIRFRAGGQSQKQPPVPGLTGGGAGG